jgi:hypothetical protein
VDGVRLQQRARLLGRSTRDHAAPADDIPFAETVLIGHRLVHNADGNVRAGVAYLAHLLHDFHGNARLALAGWYQGERAVRKHGLYKVTRPFVANVLALTARM